MPRHSYYVKHKSELKLKKELAKRKKAILTEKILKEDEKDEFIGANPWS